MRLAIAVALVAVPAQAHQAPQGWAYPIACCSNQDCRQVEAEAITETPKGYRVPNGEEIAHADHRLKPSPDGEYHWCTVSGVPSGGTICLFVPPPAYE
jgi:hypothetical protein